jgi:hypothetical protein
MVDMTPVDYGSGAIIHLSRQKESLGKVFHLVNPHPLHLSKLIKWICSFGYPVQQISYDKWRLSLLNLVGHSLENALSSLVPVFPESVSEEQMSNLIQLQFDCQNTLEGLADTSISCPKVDAELLSTYFSYLIRQGFLNAPQPSYDLECSWNQTLPKEMQR